MAEKRKLLFLTLNYYWMDRESFLDSREAIALLRSHEELARAEYTLRLDYLTFLVDLSPSEPELFAALDYKSARYPINRARKSGVRVALARDAAEKQRFHRFYRDFLEQPGRRNQVLALREEELEQLVILYALSPRGEYLGGIGLLPSPDRRYLLYKYAATRCQCGENDLLVWEAMRWAKEAGFRYFDLSWMIPGQDRDSKQYRLYQYKKKFGGELVPFYSYVRLRGPFRLAGALFKLVLKHLFHDDINRFTLALKKMRIFR